MADPDTWLPMTLLVDNGVPITEAQLAKRNEGIEIAYQKALRRRYAQRAYAKTHGLPIPSLTEPIEPHGLDFPMWDHQLWAAGERLITPTGPILPYRRDLWTPELAKRNKERAEYEATATAAAVADHKARLASYAARSKARKLGLPLPPLLPPKNDRQAEYAAYRAHREEQQQREADS